MLSARVNIALAYIAEIPEYGVELPLYGYVERNAITVAGLSLAIATFIIVTFSRVTSVEQDEKMKIFLQAVFISFLLGLLRVLPLYWVPQMYGWLTTLRHLKTIPELFSVFILGSAMIIYVDSIRIQDLKDLSLELKLRKSAEDYKKNKIEWDESLSLGINEIDEQHMMLIYRLNELSEALDKEEDIDVLYKTFNFLIDFTDYHYTAEEKILLENNSSRYDFHKGKHDEFLNTLRKLCQSLLDDGVTPELKNQVNVYIVAALINHIKGIDQELVQYTT
jgi:hemerythrin